MECIEDTLQKQVSSIVQIPFIHLQLYPGTERDKDLHLFRCRSCIHLSNDFSCPGLRICMLFQQFFMGTKLPDDTGRTLTVGFTVPLQHIILHRVLRLDDIKVHMPTKPFI